jgi:hypothetical protein
MRSVATQFGRDKSTISRLWRCRCKSISPDNEMGIFNSKIKFNSGRKGFNLEQLEERLKRVPPSVRQTFRAMAEHTGISRKVLQRLCNQNLLCRHSSRLKPALTEKNIAERIQFILRWLNEDRSQFQRKHNVVHV